jgi:hypothetical protein
MYWIKGLFLNSKWRQVINILGSYINVLLHRVTYSMVK